MIHALFTGKIFGVLRRIGVPTAFMLAYVTLISCSRSASLSRLRVAAILQEAQDFKEPKRVFIEAGENLSIITYEPEYPALKALGLIDIHGTPKMDGHLMKGLAVSLTQAGSRESQYWKQEQHGWTIPIANRQLRKIIGLRALEDGKTEVEFSWSWLPNRTGIAIAAVVDSAIAERETAVNRSEQLYLEQFSHRRVDPLLRMRMDRLRMHTVEADNWLFSKTSLDKKVDGSKVYDAVVPFYRYDDGWRPSSKAAEDLKNALRTSEK